MADVIRGDIYWAEFGPVTSSAPALRRPVVVIQGDRFNASRLATVIVVAVTTNTRLATMPGNVAVPAGVSGLTRESVINVTQLRTIDRDELGDRIGELPRYLLAELEDGLRLVLDL